jgi:hypothetical protein
LGGWQGSDNAYEATLLNVPSEITLSWQEMQMLLGERDVIIYQLQKELALANKKLADREKRDGRS